MLLASRFWLADLLVNFQVHFVACLLLCILVLVLLRRQLSAAALLVGSLFLALPIIPYIKIPFRSVPSAVAQDDEQDYRLLTYNVLQTNDRTEDVADYIASEDIDFLLLVETDKRWSDEMDFELRDHFPHRFSRPQPHHDGLMFYSKHPWKSIRLVNELRCLTVEATFSLPDGMFTLVGVHPPPPMGLAAAERRNVFLAELSRYVSRLPGSVIVAGDFNATPWSPHFRRVLTTGQLEDSGFGRGIQNTWYRYPTLLLGLPIDHVLTRGIAIRQRSIGPPIGSDHRPILFEFLVRNGQ